MSRLNWDQIGQRFYETGVDRGVLYLAGQGAVVWNGLVSIEENPSGGEPRPYYLDGLKYVNLATAEEFEATVEAFSSPPEFGPCEGVIPVYKGLFATQQRRVAFGLAYRTLVGNDVDGQEHAYKLHLVYNALSGAGSRTQTTLSDAPSANTTSWGITTMPPSLTGHKPTAHMVIDSRYTPKALLAAIEDILYGNSSVDGRLPLPNELLTMFQSEGPLVRTNHILNPSFRDESATTVEARRNLCTNPAYRTASGSTQIRANLSLNPRQVAGGAQVAAPNTVATHTMSLVTDLTGHPKGITTASKSVPIGASLVANGQILSAYNLDALGNYGTARSFGAWVYGSVDTNVNVYCTGTPAGSSKITAVPANTWTWVTSALSATGNAIVSMAAKNGYVVQATDYAYITGTFAELAPTNLPWFDALATDAPTGLVYAWSGTPNNSSSIAIAPNGRILTGAVGYNRLSWRIPGAATDGTDVVSCYLGASIDGLLLFSYDTPAAAANDIVNGRVRMRVLNSAADLLLSPRLYAYTSAGSGISQIAIAPNVALPANGDWVDIAIPAAICPANTGQARFYIASTGLTTPSAIVQASNQLIEKVYTAAQLPWSYFDGTTPAADGLTYSWAGTANASASVATAKRIQNWAATGNMPFYRTATPDGQGGYFAQIMHVNSAFSGYKTVNVGEYWAGRVTVMPSPETPVGSRVRATMHDGSVYVTTNSPTGGPDGMFVVPPEGIDVVMYSTIPTQNVAVRIYIYPEYGRPVRIAKALMERVSGPGMAPGSFFDGSTPDMDNNFYSWAGVADQSVSNLNTWN